MCDGRNLLDHGFPDFARYISTNPGYWVEIQCETGGSLYVECTGNMSCFERIVSRGLFLFESQDGIWTQFETGVAMSVNMAYLILYILYKACKK